MKMIIKQEQNKYCKGLSNGSSLCHSGAKRILLTLLMATFMIPAALMAQKVYKDGTNRVILDLTDMPPETITNVKKYTGTYTTSNVANNRYIIDHAFSESMNNQLYEKLEIAPLNINNTTSATLGAGVGMTWQQAFLRCKELNYNGTGWRLPVLRELAMMYTFKAALNAIFISMGNSNSTALPITSITSRSFWSAYEYAGSQVIFIEMSMGLANVAGKTGASMYVRCVREIN